MLNDIKEIGGFKVSHINMMAKPEDFENHIWINHSLGSIGFRIQKGPIKEEGINGCQVDTMIETCLKVLEEFNSKFSCYENVGAMQGLKDALGWLEKRKANRKERGVEGTNNI